MVLIGGESIAGTLWEQLAQCSDIDLYNVYGPTECTVDTTSALLSRSPSVPNIGRPISNTRMYLLDAHRRPVPVGVAGEIYIG